MSDPGSTTKAGDMSRFGSAWAAALRATEPALDREASLRAFKARAALGQRNARSRSRLIALAAAALLTVGAVALVLALRSVVSRANPVLEAGAYLEARAGETLPLELAEGSRVLVESGSRVRVDSVDPRGARMELMSGAVAASIVHRADTRWVFTAGPFTVRVTGTALRVLWEPREERFELEVREGSVVVSGPLLDGERRVEAGRRCRVRIPQAQVELAPIGADVRGGDAVASSSAGVRPPELPPVAVDDLPVVASSSAGAEPLTPPARPGSWQALERAGQYGEAIAMAEREGLEGIYAAGTAEDLMALARAARLSGHGDVSRGALLRCRDRFPGDSRASTAAFLLGRSVGPAEAARWFQTYLREQPNGPLAREAAGRLIEAYQQAGEPQAARAAAQRYLANYPDGPHAAFAGRVVEAQSP